MIRAQLFIPLLASLLFVGCATNRMGNQSDAQLQAYTEAAAADRKVFQALMEADLKRHTIEFKCKTNCDGVEFVYNDPNRKGVEMPMSQAEADAIIGVAEVEGQTKVINKVVPAALGAWLGIEVVDALGSAGSFVNNGRMDSDDINNSNQGNTADSGNSASATSISESGNDQSTDFADVGNTDIRDSGNDNSNQGNADNSQVTP